MHLLTQVVRHVNKNPCAKSILHGIFCLRSLHFAVKSRHCKFITAMATINFLKQKYTWQMEFGTSSKCIKGNQIS